MHPWQGSEKRRAWGCVSIATLRHRSVEPLPCQPLRRLARPVHGRVTLHHLVPEVPQRLQLLLEQPGLPFQLRHPGPEALDFFGSPLQHLDRGRDKWKRSNCLLFLSCSLPRPSIVASHGRSLKSRAAHQGCLLSGSGLSQDLRAGHRSLDCRGPQVLQVPATPMGPEGQRRLGRQGLWAQPKPVPRDRASKSS